PPTQSEPIDADPLCAALGLDPSVVTGVPPRQCGTGLDWAFLNVTDDALGRVRIDLAKLEAVGPAGICAFSYAAGRVHSRCFAAGLGVPEDPATGSAALGLGVYLVGSGLLPGDGLSSYEITQGVEMRRPSRLFCTVRADGG